MLYAIAIVLYLSGSCLGFQRIPIKPSNVRNHAQIVTKSLPILQLNLGLSDAIMHAEDVDLDALQKAIAGNAEDSTEVTVAKLIAIVFLSGILLNRLKPQGSCREDLIEVQPSFYLPSELGVVAKQLIPRGTVIGTYPGYLRSQRNMVDSKFSEEAVKKARKYQWSVLNNEYVIDPTAPNGALPKEINYCFGLLKVGTSLACMNEPPPGLDVNIYVRIEGPKVEFIAERDIRPSEELFVDYGTTYNRSDYNSKTKKSPPADSDVRNIDTKPVLEPIFDDGRSPPPPPPRTSSIKKKIDDEWDQDNGIMSPSDALDLFNSGGASGLFTDPKDRELVDSILGKTSGGSSSNSKSNSNNNKVGDEAMMEIMRRALMGPDNDETISDETSNKSKAPKVSIFDSRESTRDSSLTRGKGFASNSSPTAELAKDMEAKLDAMTDEEIEQMYAKLRSELTDNGSLSNKKEKRLSRTQPKNPEVAAKYANEFRELEQILEGMLDNPIETLRDMNLNPDKYLLDGTLDTPPQLPQQSNPDADNFGR